MRVKRVQDLHVWQQAKELANSVSAIVERGHFRNNWALRNQLQRATVSVVANIAEGFSQQTDRGFARYLFVARGSAAEVRTLLTLAVEQGRIRHTEFEQLELMCDNISRMLTGLTRYLIAEDRTMRG